MTEIGDMTLTFRQQLSDVCRQNYDLIGIITDLSRNLAFVRELSEPSAEMQEVIDAVTQAQHRLQEVLHER